jgi:hypothetical protein
MYLKGMHYEYLMAEEFGAFRVIIKIDKKYKSLEEKYIKLDLFRVSNGKFIRVNDPEVKIERELAEESKSYYLLESNRVYLPASNYRLSANIENEVFQKDFSLEPRVLQKANKDNFECMTVQINPKAAPSVPLRLYYSVNDINTKSDITDITDLYIYHNKWMKWRDFGKLKRFDDIFTTGRTYRFQFFNENYFINFVRISVKPFQTVLTIETDLVPLSGTLLYKSNVDGIQFLLNNSDHYVSGGKAREFKKIETANQENQKLRLSPGQYFITAKKSSSITRTIEAAVEPGKTTNVFINYDSASDKIEIEIQ